MSTFSTPPSPRLWMVTLLNHTKPLTAQCLAGGSKGRQVLFVVIPWMTAKPHCNAETHAIHGLLKKLRNGPLAQAPLAQARKAAWFSMFTCRPYQAAPYHLAVLFLVFFGFQSRLHPAAMAGGKPSQAPPNMKVAVRQPKKKEGFQWRIRHQMC